MKDEGSSSKIMMIWRAYWPSMYKHRWLALLMVLFMLFSVLTKSVTPFLARNLLEGLTGDPDLVGGGVWKTFWLLAAALLAHNVAWFMYDPAIVIFEAQMLRDIEQRCFAKVQSMSMRFFESTFAGSLVTATKRFRGSFEGITDAFVFQLGRSAILTVITLFVFARENTTIATLFGIWIIIYCIVSFYLARLRLPRDVAAADAESVLGGSLADTYSNQSTVKSFAKEEYEQDRFNKQTDDCYKKRRRAWLFGNYIGRAQSLILMLFELVVNAILIYGWRDGTVTAGDFVFYQTYILILLYQIWDVGNVMNRVFQHLADAEEMAELFATEPEVQDSLNARPLNVEEGRIHFHSVNFSYGDNGNASEEENNDVHNFDLVIEPGESVALVGHSGAGKSTLVKLLLRYFDLVSGYIRIDNQDIAYVTQKSLREFIAVVSQETSLFHRTIRDNIRFARPDATDEEVIEAAKKASAWGFISRMPNGLDTIVGERGVKLSGGERQRVALARAFLADLPILVLDEATSALDSKTERQIQNAIKTLLVGRTSIVIAHRLSTIQEVDKIVVMENGSIAEVGTHKELLEKDGIYANLWDHQSGGYIA